MNSLPALAFGSLLALVYGAAFHVWRAGNLGRLAFHLLISLLGFWLAAWIATRLGVNWLTVGALPVGMATLGSLAFLFLGEWLYPKEMPTTR